MTDVPEFDLEEIFPGTPLPPTADHVWTEEEVGRQIRKFAFDVISERLAQEQRWGRQNIPDLQKGSDGVREIGLPYRSLEQIMKYQCDRARDLGRRSMDLVLLEEVFEALAKAVEVADAETAEERDDLRKKLIEELVQVAAVATKWAAMVERDEPRHG